MMQVDTIPIFPEKRVIALEDKKLVCDLFLELSPQVSEFTFTNLFCWRQAYSINFSKLNDFLIIFSEVNNHKAFFDPVGQGDKKKIIKICLQEFPQAKFFRLPESSAQLFNTDDGYKLLEDRDNFDYVYRRADLVLLKGKKFDAKRNFIKRFYKQYNPVCRQASEKDIEHCIRLHDEWCDDKACDLDISLKREKEAIIEMLKNCHTLGVLGAVIEIEGEVKAFSIGEPLNNTTFVVHAEKANAKFVGIYQAMNNFFASIVPEKYEFINREQDLGLLNLRKAKLSYKPSNLVKKFTLTRN
jgi:hypothetical protein